VAFVEGSRVFRTSAVRLVRCLALLGVVAPVVLVAPAAVGASATPFAVVLRPSLDGNTAARSGQRVLAAGQVPDGALTAARLVGIAGDGSEQRQTLSPSVLGGTGSDGGDFLRVEAGELSGRLSLFCIFGPQPSCPPEAPAPRPQVRQVVLELDLAGTRGRSAPLRIDFTRPTVRDSRLSGPREVVVRFSEPVRQPGLQQDAAGDWQVADAVVLSVGGPTPGDCVGGYRPNEDASAGPTGCTRTLRLASSLDEDATPKVDYVLFDDRLPGRGTYEDFASGALIYSGTATTTAADAIRPATPKIDTVNGAAPPAGGWVDTSVRQPVVAVSNLRAGHEVFARVTQEGGTPSDGPALVASGGTATLQVPPLPVDGSYRLEAVARDRARNTSTETDKTAARGDGTPSVVTYLLDTEVPALAGALTDDSTVRVSFTEAVRGSDNPADFTITAPGGLPRTVTAVSPGADARERVLSAIGVPVGATLRYQPPAGSTRYGDAAGHGVPDTTALVQGVPVPTVLEPATAVWTSAASTAVQGTSRGGTVVRIHRDDGADGTPDGPAVASVAVPAGSTRYAVDVPLVAGARNDLVAVAADQGTGATSGAARIPAVTQDATPPQFALSAPSGGEVLPGGAPFAVRYSTCDAHGRNGPVRIEYSADGGATYVEVAPSVGPACTSDGSYDWTPPRVSAASARLRLTATDLAGNRTAVVSPPFSIDAVTPRFTATTRGAREVAVTFAEPVSGPLRGTDWTIGSQAVAAVSSDGTAGPVPGSVIGARHLTLRLAGTSSAIGRDDGPLVTYAPPEALGQLRDGAGQRVAPGDRTVEALDGIVPAAPTVTAPAGATVTGAREVTVRGAVEPGSAVQAFGGGQLLASAPAGSDGYALVVPLRPDRRNELELRAVDGNGNASAPTRLDVVQDGLAPVVAVTAPSAGSRVEPDAFVTISWRADDLHLRQSPITLEYSLDGGRTLVPIVQDIANTGSYVWRTPATVTPDAAVQVRALDQAGNVGAARTGVFGIGQAARPQPALSASPVVPARPAGTSTAQPGATSGSSPSADAAQGTATGTFHPLDPARLLDTRNGTGGPTGRLGSGQTMTVQVTGAAGVPAHGVGAVVLNLTVVQPTASTHLTLWPSDTELPDSSSLNTVAGRTLANLTTVAVGDNGSVSIFNSLGTAHVVVDVFGWYSDEAGPEGSAFAALQPERLLDTRTGAGTGRVGPVGPRGTVQLQVAGRGGVPSTSVSAVVLNVTAVAASAPSHLVVAPSGSAQPLASNLNVGAGDTVANLVTVPVGPDGAVQIGNRFGNVHVVADVFGWYGAAAAGATDVLVPVPPRRMLDTRRDGAVVGADRSLTLHVAGIHGLPPQVTGIVMNLTAVRGTRGTHITAYPDGTRLPLVSNVNAPALRTVANLAVVRVPPSGALTLRNDSGEVHLLADVTGYFRRR
jgi:hypothetical protein